MSLYLLEHDVVYQIIFLLFSLSLAVLFVVSGIEIYRSQGVSGSRRKLNKVRYITGWCLLIQCATFTAYYMHWVVVHAALWMIWIPSWCSAYILLSYNLSKIRVPSRSSLAASTQKKDSRQMMWWKMVWCLWSGCTLSLWIGSLYGWWLPDLEYSYHIQAFGQLLWKLIAFFLLNLCVFLLINIQKMITATIALFESHRVLDLEKGSNGSKDDQQFQTAEADKSTPNINVPPCPEIPESPDDNPDPDDNVMDLPKMQSVSSWNTSPNLPKMASTASSNASTVHSPNLPKMASTASSNASVQTIATTASTTSRRTSRTSKVSRYTTWMEEEQVAELETALKKINALILCEVALSLCLVVTAVYESYVIYQICMGQHVGNIYAESTVLSMACYFPLWTLIHIVLLVYGWIPRESVVPPVVQDLVDYVTEETPEGGDNDYRSHGNVPTDPTPSSASPGTPFPSELKIDDIPDLTRFAF